MKKNLLFVFADQWRRCSLGIYDQDPVFTPNMDTFSRKAVVCNNVYSSCPLCSPARAALLTGLRPLETGVFTNCKNALDIRLRDEDICISDVLKREGYQTGYIGKWHLDEPETNNYKVVQSGAEKWDAYTEPGPRRHNFDFWHAYNACDNHNFPHYWENTSSQLVYDKWSPIHETDVAIDFLDNCNKEMPFALYLSWNPPHSPYDTAPDCYKALYRDLNYFRKNVELSRLGSVMHHTFEPFPLNYKEAVGLTRNYFAAISGLDDQFGRLIRYLKEKKLYENTIVVLTADHGDMLLSHSLIGKHVWYEESIGIPFVIGGGGLEAGCTETVFCSEDIPSTLLDLLHIEIPESWKGKSVAKSIVERSTNEDSCSFIAAYPGRDVFVDAYKRSGDNILLYGWRAVRTNRYTYVIDAGYLPGSPLEYYLFDNIVDPFQMHPKTGDVARTTAFDLDTLLVSHLKTMKDPFVLHLD